MPEDFLSTQSPVESDEEIGSSSAAAEDPPDLGAVDAGAHRPGGGGEGGRLGVQV